MLKVEALVKDLSIKLAKVPRINQSQESAIFSNQFASIYYDEISAKVNASPDKLKLLDRAVEFITKSPKNSRALCNAYIMATANLLELATIEDVEKVMDYIESKPSGIREPEKMGAAIANVPSTTKVRLQQFLKEVAVLLKPIGENLGRVD